MTKTERQTLKAFAEKHGVSLSSVWRWVLTGVKGKKLMTHILGGRRYVTPEAERAFLNQEEEEPRTQSDNSLSQEIATSRLDAIFAKKRGTKSVRVDQANGPSHSMEI